MDNSDGFWTEYGHWVIRGFVGLGLMAIFVFGGVTIISALGAIFS